MNRLLVTRSAVCFWAALIVSAAAFPPARAAEPEGASQADAFSRAAGQVLSPQGAYLTVTNFTAAGLVEARIYRNSGHLSLVGPDLAGNALANAVTFSPPLVRIGGQWHNLGPIVSSRTIGDGLEAVQQLLTTNVVVRLTFVAEGVMRYEVVNWSGLPVEEIAVAAASDAGEHFYGFGEKFN
ncbi:MAG TPA: hypothetical protein VN836_12025, partial [Verrucomicrobiae bacterium]|nr:hypothetical protein [Verrucomicrobiae bacterium]